MIMAFVGALGAGKSYSMVELGLRYLAQGYKVYSVTKDIVYAEHVTLDAVPALISASADGKQDSVLLMDEAGLLLFSRDWAKKDHSPLLQFVITSRKRGFHILYTAQYREMVDKVLREVTTDVVHCFRIGTFGIRLYSTMEIEFYKFSSRIYSLYDTTSGYYSRMGFSEAVDRAIERSLLSLSAKRVINGQPFWRYNNGNGD